MKKKKKRRLRSEIKMYIVLFSLLASMVTMMIFHKSVINIDKLLSGLDQSEVVGGDIVVLDPGHGGFDPGSEYHATYEKDITLAIAKLTGEYLTEKGIKVVYTRSSDVALADYERQDLQARIDIGMNEEAMYFVSFHMNEGPSEERSSGFEVFENATSGKSSFLANQVSDSLEALSYTQRRSILDGRELYVVSFNPVPAVLIEMGFLNDEEDRTYLLSSEGQQNVAIAIGKAIVDSLEHYK